MNIQHVKKAIVLLVVCVAFTACHRDKFYVCNCIYKGSTGDSLERYTIGRKEKQAAYVQCASMSDSTGLCDMEIHE